MNIKNISFQSIDWKTVPKTEHKGKTGVAYWQTIQLHGLRIRVVEYTENFILDHWCKKGHIVHCLEGDFINDLKGSTKSFFTQGMSFVVSDELSSHRLSTENGAKLLIIDGDFLNFTTEEIL